MLLAVVASLVGAALSTVAPVPVAAAAATTTALPGQRITIDPPAQVRYVYSPAAELTITVLDEAGDPVPNAPIHISRKGTNVHYGEQFVTDANGRYVYRYFGYMDGTDVVQATDMIGHVATATVTTYSVPGGNSADWCPQEGDIVNGWVHDTHVLVSTAPFAGRQWICFHVQSPTWLRLGGRIELVGAGMIFPVADVRFDEWSAGQCLPIGTRLVDTVVDGRPFTVDVAPNPHGTVGAFVCMHVLGIPIFLRVDTTTPPAVIFHVDDQLDWWPYAEEPMTGSASRVCQESGGTRLLNLIVRDQHVALYTLTGGSAHVCVAAGGTGAHLFVDPANPPTVVPPTITLGSNELACPWVLFEIHQPFISVRTPDPTEVRTPASVCVTAAGMTQRATIDTAGNPYLEFDR